MVAFGSQVGHEVNPEQRTSFSAVVPRFESDGLVSAHPVEFGVMVRSAVENSPPA